MHMSLIMHSMLDVYFDVSLLDKNRFISVSFPDTIRLWWSTYGRQFAKFQYLRASICHDSIRLWSSTYGRQFAKFQQEYYSSRPFLLQENQLFSHFFILVHICMVQTHILFNHCMYNRLSIANFEFDSDQRQLQFLLNRFD